ncbi:TonB-dependent receptor domain-containing protein [Novosphingobium sp. JCM 18896]|uniref:TonB-dependent receptor domain-containing protein n=1 Tax=Novosphingobium sp. JCM 18896 TaxID=2989731 RepID=UPI002221678E|nr:TonB-dependent receptor [Novosphingobium sp. JCM 18896]MCW1430665.1 TonB-dependent receptor [Novosphingobium sp. JCM 18896]
MFHNRRSYAANCASLAVLALATYAAPALAKDEPKPLTAWEASRTIDDDATVKTGVAKARDPLDSATSTSVLKDNEVVKLSAPSLADLFRNIPGIRVEGGAGEGLNSYTVRGLPLVNGGAKYVQIQEDGLPVLEFGDLTNMGPDAFVRADINLASVESIRGGSASTFASNAPGGVINLISKTGEVEGGSVRLSTGLDHDSNRIDFDYGHRLGDGWRFHVGGFYRRGEGPRETGYTAMRGGQIKLNATKEFDGGYIRFYGKVLDDKFPGYIASPMSVTGTNDKPVFRPLAQFNAVDDTMMSRYISDGVQVNSSGNVVRNDAQDGYRVKANTIGTDVVFSLGEWNFSERFRYSDISGQADILDPQIQFAAASTLLGYFAPGGSIQYASGPQKGTAVNPVTVSGNGLVSVSTIGHTNINSLNNVTNDFRVSRVWEVGGGDLTTTAGLYNSQQTLDREYYASIIVQDLVGGGNSALLNVKDATGRDIFVNGAYAYDDSLNGKKRVKLDYNVLAPYGSFNFHTGKLSVGGSVRYDRGSVSGTIARGTARKVIDVNGNGTTAGDRAEQGASTGQVVGIPYIAPGSSQPVDYDYDYVSYSMGVNYRVSKSFSVFARHSLGGRAGADALLFSPAISATSGALLNEDAGHDSVRQTEAGFKYRNNGISLNLTGFYATTKGTYLPTIADSLGIKTPTLVSRSYHTYGAEVEGAVRRGPFSVTGSVTVTGGEIKAAEQAALVGKQPRRQPTLLYTLTPQFDIERVTIGANILGQTSSYADDVNLLKMPGFTTVGAFARYRPVDRIELGLNVSNLFNTKAITEVNSGGGAIPATGLATVRTLYGRLISASAQFFF